jgi:hypothetical protein
MIRLLGDFDAARRHCTMPSPVAEEQWALHGVLAS